MSEQLRAVFRERPVYRDLLALAGYSVTAFLYYRDTFQNWFISDDIAFILASMEPLTKIFFTKSVSYAFYLPMGSLSFRPDALLFGLNPLPYHLHNTLVLVLVCFMVYKILRLYVSWPVSFFTPLIVLLSPPSLVTLLWLTVRTYLYGMLFALLAIYLHLRFRPVSGKRWGLVLLVMAFCELSFMTTERYMTLPLVLLVLSQGTVRERIFETFPYVIILGLHGLLRWHVMGGVGGYLGFSLDPALYAKTTVTSLFTASRVLFGFSWVILILPLPLLLLKPKGLATAALLWLTALPVQFIVMFFYPSLDTYRYWFMPAVLFSFLVGICSTVVKNTSFRTLYLAAVLTLFIVHAYPLNRDLKGAFERGSRLAETVSKLLVDTKYREDLVLYPDDTHIVASGYIERMAAAYRSMAGLDVTTQFFPFEILAFYPEVARDVRDVYEVRGNEAVRITDSLSDRIRQFMNSVKPVRPVLTLSKEADGPRLRIACESGMAIDAYTITKVGGRTVTSKTIAPYVEDLTPFIRSLPSQRIEILPLEILSFRQKEWNIRGVAFGEGASTFLLSCVDVNGRRTGLSDMIYVHGPGESVKYREGSR